MGLLTDARNMQSKDPAATSLAQVMLLYPGFHVLIFYKVGHWLYRHKRFFLARMVSQWGRGFTGIEIHPGATIGPGLFIDHGMGVVIGETAEIGANCTIYHQVTLGGTGKDTGKRHPTLGDNVLIARVNLLMTFEEYLQERWKRKPTRAEYEKIVGSPLNKFTRFLSFKKHIMTIEVSHPAILRELNDRLKNTIIAKVNAVAGSNVCRELKAVPAGQS